MKRQKSTQVARLVEAATGLFIDKGYRRAQMADVTQAMGLSPGAVYRYVESKEALFDLIVRAGAMPEQSFNNLKLPVVTPKPGATVRFLRETLHREGQIKSLESALKRKSTGNPKEELAGIVREIYSRIARYR